MSKNKHNSEQQHTTTHLCTAHRASWIFKPLASMREGEREKERERERERAPDACISSSLECTSICRRGAPSSVGIKGKRKTQREREKRREREREREREKRSENHALLSYAPAISAAKQ